MPATGRLDEIARSRTKAVCRRFAVVRQEMRVTEKGDILRFVGDVSRRMPRRVAGRGFAWRAVHAQLAAPFPLTRNGPHLTLQKLWST